jgi:hypothetical protein
LDKKVKRFRFFFIKTKDKLQSLYYETRQAKVRSDQAGQGNCDNIATRLSKGQAQAKDRTGQPWLGQSMATQPK